MIDPKSGSDLVDWEPVGEDNDLVCATSITPEERDRLDFEPPRKTSREW